LENAAAMGFAAWFAKKTVSGMVHAVCNTYRELKSTNALPEAELCQEVVRRRLLGGITSALMMDPARRFTLPLLLPTVQNLEDACCTILTMEITTRKNCPVSSEEFHQLIRDILAKKQQLHSEPSA
jgi:hypothetical protein